MKQAAVLNLTLEQDELHQSLVGTLDDEAIIGSSEGATLVLNDWRCSGIHALIKKIDEETFRVVDLGSTYGTHKGEESFSQYDFKDGETFRVGNHELKLIYLDKTELQKLPLYSPGKIKKENQELILSTEKTVLEVSLFWGEGLLEVKQFRSGEKISIGNPKHATFGIPEELLPPGIKDHSFVLATYQESKLKLAIPQAATGLLWTDEKVLNLDTLRLYKNMGKLNGVSELNLRLGDKAHIELGELVFSFRFIHPAKKIHKSLVPKWNKQLTKIIAAIMLFYSVIFFIASFSSVEQKVTKIEDIPKHLKKVIYDTGIKTAKEKRESAVGEVAKTSEGGRARSEEGKASAKKEMAEKSQEKVQADKPVKAEAQKSKAPVTVATREASKKESLDFDKSFAEAAPSEVAATSAIVSHAKVNGTSAVALADGGFARGSKGLGAGGGGVSVGVGALKGSGMGGGMGAGDYGLAPSKGTEIKVPTQDEVEVMGGLDPEVIARIIKRYLPQIQYCYEQQLVSKPNLKGKVAVAFVIQGDGSVAQEKVTETTLKDNPTEACILAKIKHWKFPKPLGGGTVGVNYPFILMSNNSK